MELFASRGALGVRHSCTLETVPLELTMHVFAFTLIESRACKINILSF